MKKIKLDENFPPVSVEIFKKAKITAASVLDQKLSSSPDDNLYKVCISEKRALVTFDLDFANIIRFPSQNTPGIIVCRLRKKTSLAEINVLCNTLVSLITSNDLEGKLFIVEHHRIRIRRPPE